MLKKNAKKKNLHRASPTARATHNNIFFSDSCTGVHGFEEKSKFHVPGGYMNLKRKIFLCVAKKKEKTFLAIFFNM